MAKNISQAEFAGLFNLARPSVGAYEEGRSEPKIDTIIQIAHHFRVSIDVLLTRELTVNDIYSFGLVNEKLNKAHKLTATAKEPLAEAIAFVEVKEYINYLVQYQNGDFVSNLRRIAIPKGNVRTMRAFEMNGSEMEYHQQGLHHGDILIGKKVEVSDLYHLHGALVTLVTVDGIINKRIESADDKQLKLITDDPNYDAMVIDLEQILEAWKVEAVYSTYLNPPTILEERVMKLEKIVEELTKE